MFDQLIIGNNASYDDFEASICKRKIGNPKKKIIKESVPFSNLTYDFSDIDGECYYEERELEYTFEITADTPEKLEELKMNFSSWVMNTMRERLYDPFVKKYYFLATFEDISFDDDESIEKTTATVKFKAYPYKIAIEGKGNMMQISKDISSLVVQNNSSHPVIPTLNADVACQVTIGNLTYGMPAGTVKDETIKLAIGTNEIKVKATESEGWLAIEFSEEVF